MIAKTTREKRRLVGDLVVDPKLVKGARLIHSRAVEVEVLRNCSETGPRGAQNPFSGLETAAKELFELENGHYMGYNRLYIGYNRLYIGHRLYNSLLVIHLARVRPNEAKARALQVHDDPRRAPLRQALARTPR